MCRLTTTVLIRIFNFFSWTKFTRDSFVSTLFFQYFAEFGSKATAYRLMSTGSLRHIVLYYADNQYARCPPKLHDDIYCWIKIRRLSPSQLKKLQALLLDFLETISSEDSEMIRMENDISPNPTTSSISKIMTQIIWFALYCDCVQSYI